MQRFVADPAGAIITIHLEDDSSSVPWHARCSHCDWFDWAASEDAAVTYATRHLQKGHTMQTRSRTQQAIVCPGNGTRYWVIVGEDEDGTPFVALPDFGKAATMAYRHAHVSYVAQKLGLSDPDAEAVTAILNDLPYDQG